MGNVIWTLRGQRPNHDTQWLYDDQWEPIFSLLLKKDNRTNLEGDKEKSMINKSYKDKNIKWNIGSQMNS